MKEHYNHLLRNYKAYIVVLVVFFVWMLFFDEFNWFRINKDKQKLEYLKREEVLLRNKIEEDRQKLKTVQSNDPESLERFAREQYYMKKDNEDVFVIEE